MKTILLAAGIGQRLGSAADNKPKCLLEFDNVSLLRRHIDILSYYEIGEIIIVTGYGAERITRELSGNPVINKIKTVHNPDYKQGSMISMLTGLEFMDINDDFLLMDADVLYDHRIVERLVQTKIQDCFLLDRNFIPGEEPVKICVRDGLMIEFRKKIAEDLVYDCQGESVGFFRFTKQTARQLILSAKKYLQQGEVNQPYEECIRDLLLANPNQFGFEDITGLKWLEIDFPEDVSRAKNEILPAILQL